MQINDLIDSFILLGELVIIILLMKFLFMVLTLFKNLQVKAILFQLLVKAVTRMKVVPLQIMVAELVTKLQ